MSEWRTARETIKGARVIQVIETNLTLRGEGKAPDDPVRSVKQYWDFDGNLLWECDPWKDQTTGKEA